MGASADAPASRAAGSQGEGTRDTEPPPAVVALAPDPTRPTRLKPTSPVARYAAARVAIDTGTPAGAAASAHGFDAGSWAKRHRGMLLRARRDSLFERELTEALAEARRAHARSAVKQTKSMT